MNMIRRRQVISMNSPWVSGLRRVRTGHVLFSAGIVLCLLGSASRAAVIWDEATQGDLSNASDASTVLPTLQSGINRVVGSIGRFSSPDTADVATFTVPEGHVLSNVILEAYDDQVYYDYVPFTLYAGATTSDPEIEFILLNEAGAGTDLLQFDSQPGPQPSGDYTFRFSSIQQSVVVDERSTYVVNLTVTPVSDCDSVNVIWDESTQGDLPSILPPLQLCVNEIRGEVGFDDPNYSDSVQFEVPAGWNLQQFVIVSLPGIGFIGPSMSINRGPVGVFDTIEFVNTASFQVFPFDLLQFDSAPGPQPAGTYNFHISRSPDATGAYVIQIITAVSVDKDKDGVLDEADVCCNTPVGVAVDVEGRPVGDVDKDCDVDVEDHALLAQNMTGPLVLEGPCCVAVASLCDDGAVCTIDFCDPVMGCVNDSDGGP